MHCSFCLATQAVCRDCVSLPDLHALKEGHEASGEKHSPGVSCGPQVTSQACANSAQEAFAQNRLPPGKPAFTWSKSGEVVPFTSCQLLWPDQTQNPKGKDSAGVLQHPSSVFANPISQSVG